MAHWHGAGRWAWPILGHESERGPAAQRRLGRVSDEKIHARALLVTEDLQTGDIWAHALSQRGVDVVLVGSDEGAWQRWAEEAFELAIADFYAQQPAMIALCGRFRTETGDCIQLLTPRGDEARLLEAYQASVDECIVEPVSPPMLLARVLAWLRSVRVIPTGRLAGERR